MGTTHTFFHIHDGDRITADVALGQIEVNLGTATLFATAGQARHLAGQLLNAADRAEEEVPA